MDIILKIKEKIKSSHLHVLILFFVLSFTIYHNVLNGEFVSDDYSAIVENLSVRHINDLKAIWESFNARSLVGYTFALNHYFNGLNVFWYHFVNILIHAVNSFLVFKFIFLSFQTAYFRKSALYERAFSLAFLSSLLFLCHPIQTQAVAFITQRAVLMGTFFYMCTLILYIKFRATGKKHFFVLSLISTLFGLISKEIIFTVPVIIFVYEMFFIEKDNEKFFMKLKNMLPFIIVVLFLPFIILQDRAGSVLGLKSQLNKAGFSFNYFFTKMEIFCQYISLVFLPINQNHHYDFPISTGIFYPGTVISLSFIIVLVILGTAIFKKNRLLSFCIFWVFVTSSIETLVGVFIHRKLIDEHWFYLPMVGVCLLISILIINVFKGKKEVAVFAVIILLIFSTVSIKRNKVWQTEIGFWEDVLRKSPYTEWAYIGAGRAYTRKGFYKQAEKIYTKGLNFNPNSFLISNELGVIYARKNLYPLALQYFDKAIKYNPNFAKAYNNLAFTYYLNGRFKESLELYDKSLSLQGDYTDGYYYKGVCLQKLGRKKEALKSFNKALILYEKKEDQEGVSKVLNSIKAQLKNNT